MMGAAVGARYEATDEFRRDAVELVLSTGMPMARVAADLDVWTSDLRCWLREHGSRVASRRVTESEYRRALQRFEHEHGKPAIDPAIEDDDPDGRVHAGATFTLPLTITIRIGAGR